MVQIRSGKKLNGNKSQRKVKTGQQAPEEGPLKAYVARKEAKKRVTTA